MKLKSRYNWSDIKLYQIQEIDTLPEFDSKLDMMIEQLSILIDTDPYEIKKLPVEDLVREFKKWDFINETPQPKAHEKIKVNGVKYKLIDFDKMSLAQLVDIEEYVSDGIIKNAHKILSVLYLPYKNILSKELKPYQPNKELPYIRCVISYTGFFLSYRTDLFRRFSTIFGDENRENDTEDDTGGKKTIGDAKAEAEEKIREKWNWMKLIELLSNDDILKMEQVVKLPMLQCLTYLQYKLEMNNIE
jgi:hypothetical protein